MSAGISIGAAAAGLALNQGASGGPPGPAGGFPGYGLPGSTEQDYVLPVDGVALTVSRSDHRHNDFPSPDSFLFYCVDYDGVTAAADATTARPGYSPQLATAALTRDAALAAAQLTPFKTLERAHQLLPHHGNGSNLVILIKPRAAFAPYRNIANTADQVGDWMSELIGWNGITIRGSDLTNTAADKILCGFGVEPGTNAAGYSAGAGSTTSSLIGILTAAGVAPALPLEAAGFSTVSGLRIRFDAATPTAALRNVCSAIWKNGTDSIVPSENLPAAPIFVAPGNAANDVFVIETPGVVLGNLTAEVGGNLRLSLAGITSLTTSTQETLCQVRAAGLRFNADHVARSVSLTFNRFYLDELGAAINVGFGRRVAGTTQAVSTSNLADTSSALLGAQGAVFEVQTYSVQGSLVPKGFNAGRIARCLLGSNISSTRKLRVNQATTQPGLRVQAAVIGGVDFSNCTQPLISVISPDALRFPVQRIVLDAVVSPDGGNTDVVLDVSAAKGAEVVLGAGNTAAATLGHVRFAADATTCLSPNAFNTVPTFEGQRDTNGNTISATAKAVLISASVSRFLSADAAAVPEFHLVRKTAAAVPFECVMARADTAANSDGLCGVSINRTAIGLSGLMAGSGYKVVNFDTAIVVGQPAYLSDATFGRATSVAPVAPSLVIRIGTTIADLGGGLGVVLLCLCGEAEAEPVAFSVEGDAPIAVAEAPAGTFTVSHDDSGVAPDTYTSVTVDAKGHVTAGSNPAPGGVTSVTATAPISSTGGVTPDISHDDSGVAAGQYLFATVTVDAKGHVTAIEDRGPVQQLAFSCKTVLLGSDAYLLSNGNNEPVTTSPSYPSMRPTGSQLARFWVTAAASTGTGITLKLKNLTAATEETIAFIADGTAPTGISNALTLDFAAGDRIAVEISQDGEAAGTAEISGHIEFYPDPV